MRGEGPGEGFVVWMTGLPASGKSTLSKLLEKELRERQGRRVEVLDGDEVRKMGLLRRRKMPRSVTTKTGKVGHKGYENLYALNPQGASYLRSMADPHEEAAPKSFRDAIVLRYIQDEHPKDERGAWWTHYRRHFRKNPGDRRFANHGEAHGQDGRRHNQEGGGGRLRKTNNRRAAQVHRPIVPVVRPAYGKTGEVSSRPQRQGVVPGTGRSRLRLWSPIKGAPGRRPVGC